MNDDDMTRFLVLGLAMGALGPLRQCFPGLFSVDSDS